MTTSNIRRSIVRLAAAVAVMASLALSSGVAAADHWTVGLNECDLGGCAVVTIDDLREARAERQFAVYRQAKFPAGPYDPQFLR
jgi:hypothetical protein